MNNIWTNMPTIRSLELQIETLQCDLERARNTAEVLVIANVQQAEAFEKQEAELLADYEKRIKENRDYLSNLINDYLAAYLKDLSAREAEAKITADGLNGNVVLSALGD